MGTKNILLNDKSSGVGKATWLSDIYSSIDTSSIPTAIKNSGLDSHHELTSITLRVEPCYYRCPDFTSGNKKVNMTVWLCNSGSDNGGTNLCSSNGNIPKDSGGKYTSTTIANYISTSYPFSIKNTSYAKTTVYFEASGSTWDWNVYFKLYLDVVFDTYYTIKFVDWNDAELKSERIKEGNTPTAPGNPSRRGYAFSGWDKSISSASVDTTYKAVYTPITYNIAFNANGGTSGSMNTLSAKFDSDIKLTVNGFSRKYDITYDYGYDSQKKIVSVNYSFNGWEDRGSIVASDGKTYSADVFDAPYYANTYSDLYNAFKYNKYNLINHYINSGKSEGRSPVSSNGARGTYPNGATVNSLCSTQGSTDTLYAQWNSASVTLPTLTRTGYTFNGWYTAASGGTKIGNGGASYTPTANITLYAQWTAISDINYENLFSLSNWLNSASSTLNGGSTNYDIECDNVNGSIKIIDKSGGSTDTYTPMSGSGIYTIPVEIGTTYVFKCDIETNGTARPLIFATNGSLDGWTSVLLDVTVGSGNGQQWTFTPTTNHIHFRFGTVTTDNTYAKFSNIQVYKESRTYLLDRIPIKRQLINLTSLQTLSKTGYTFNGWYDNENLTGSAVTLSWAQSRTTGTTIYSKWFDHRINFTYYGNNGNNIPFKHWEAIISQGWPDNHWNYTKEDVDYYQTKTGYLSKQHPSSGSKGTYEIRDKSGRVIGEVGEDQKFNSYQELCNAHGVNISTQSTELDLYALWVPINYTIIFDANSGTGSMDSLLMKYDESKELSQCTFKKTGYTFQGWSRNKNATSATYSDKQSVSNLTAEDGAGVTLYAVWKANEYTVNYHGNGNTGGSTKSSNHVYDVSKQLTENGFERIYHVTYDPNKGQCSINTNSAAYEFLGWKDSSGKEYSNKQTVSNLIAQKEGQFHLYAQWEPKSVILPKPTRTGYTFNGWYTEDNKPIGMDGESYTPSSSIILEAHWIEHKYRIEFYGNGEDDENGGSMEPMINIGYDQEIRLSSNGYLKTGYHFHSWNTKSDGTGFSPSSNELVKNLTDVDGGTVKLYVQWKPNVYIINFMPNGGASETGELMIQTHTYDSSLNLLKNIYTRKGYTFLGWAKTAEAKEPEFVDEQEIINLISEQGNTFVYAVWRANTYTISFNGNGFTNGEMSEILNATYDVPIKLPENRYSKIGHTFLGWGMEPFATEEQIKVQDGKEAENLTDKDGAHVVLYAVWNQLIYNITWKKVKNGEDVVLTAYGGTIPEYPETPYINPTEEIHHIFIGWNRTILIADRHTEYLALYEIGKHSFTKKEVFEPKGDALNCEQGYTRHYCDVCNYFYDDSYRWSVVFKDWNDDTVSAKKVPINSEFFAPASKKKPDNVAEKYVFDGWYEVQTSEQWIVGKKATSNLTYKAHYISIPQMYQVNWYDGDGTLMASEMVQYGEPVPTTTLHPTLASDGKNSYTFQGWREEGTDAEGNVIGPVNCYPEFSATELSYEVIWKNSNGVVLHKEVGFSFKEKVPVYPGGTPIHPNAANDLEYEYDFTGWRNEIENRFYPEGEDLPLVTSSATYIATYRKIPKEYSVTIHIMRLDEKIEIVYEGLRYNESFYIDAHYYGMPRGYTFINWSDGIQDIERKITVKGNDVYTANYERNKYPVKWLDYNNKEIITKEQFYKTIPNHKEVEKDYIFMKSSDEKYHYEFNGKWEKLQGTTMPDGEILGSAIYRAVYDEIEHNWEETIFNFYITIDEASATRHCSECGRIEEERVKLVKQIKKDEEATCDAPGYLSYLAPFSLSWNKLDGPRVHKVEIPALGHLWSAAKKIGEDGEYGYHCIVCHRCNKAKIEEHIWSEGKPNIPGACVYGGTIKRHCTIPGCTAVYYEKVIPGQHADPLDFIVTAKVPATCEENGHEQYKQCPVCKMYFSSGADENTVEGSYTTSPFVIPALGHNYNIEEIKKASCNDDGSITLICANKCNINKYFVIPKRQHEWKAVEPINKSELPCKIPYGINYECINEESKYYIKCEDIYTDEKVLDPHTPVTIKGAPPTCTETGEADGVRCDVCGEILVKKHKLSPLGHHLVSKNLVPAENTLRREIMNSCVRKGCDYKIHLYYSD